MGRQSLDSGRVPIFGDQKRRRPSRPLEIDSRPGPHCLGNMLTDRRYLVLQLVMASQFV